MAAGSDHVDEGGAAVQAVLGLSMTSTGVGWVLLDGHDADAAALDHDAFDVGTDVATEVDISKHSAAVRGAQAIATASGHEVKSIGVTWTDDVDGQATLLLKSLPDLGFDNIIEIRLPEATRRWADAFGPVLGFTKCALCVMESTAATVLVVGNGTVHTSVTEMGERMDGLSRWLKDLFEQNRWQPDTLFLMGQRGDLELVSAGLEEALQTPVVASDDAQLALARGAALALSPKTTASTEQAGADQHVRAAATTTVIAEPESTKADDDSPTQHQPSFGEHAQEAATTVTAAEDDTKPVDDSPKQGQPSLGEHAQEAATTTVIAKEDDTKPVAVKPAHRRAWFGPHARAATVLVAGVIALFAVGPELVGQKESTSTENRPAANSSAASAPSAESNSAGTSSASVHAVPSPIPVRAAPQEARPLAAEPPPAPTPPDALPPRVSLPAPEPADDRATATSVVAQEEPVAAQPAAAPHLPVTEQPAVAPHLPATEQPVLAPQAPVTDQPAVAPPLPFALPPWLLPPPAQSPPQPAAPQHLVAPPPPAVNPAPAAANPAPAAANPAPAAPPPPAPNPAPAPPQDPFAVVLGPFFGALP